MKYSHTMSFKFFVNSTPLDYLHWDWLHFKFPVASCDLWLLYWTVQL